MDLSKLSEKLSLEKRFLEKLIKKHTLMLKKYKGIEFFNLKRKTKHLEKGTVIFLNTYEVVRGFQKIRRALELTSAIKKHMREFAVEEKLDGYNVRIAKVADELFAITRGGLICPFSTYLVNETINKDFFKDYPNLVLCTEFVGPLNPHVSHDYEGVKDIDFFVFDIREKNTNRPLPVLERRKLLEKYKIKQVPLLGTYNSSEAEKVLDLVRDLDKRGREGIVIKDLQMKKQIKYTTSNSSFGDLSFGFKFPFDVGRDFMFRRILRQGFQAFEMGDDEAQAKERAHKLGESILLPMLDSIKTVAEGKKLTDDSIIENNPALNEFLQHLEESSIKFHVEKADNKVKIKKSRPSTNDKINAYLSGEFCGE